MANIHQQMLMMDNMRTFLRRRISVVCSRPFSDNGRGIVFESAWQSAQRNATLIAALVTGTTVAVGSGIYVSMM